MEMMEKIYFQHKETGTLENVCSTQEFRTIMLFLKSGTCEKIEGTWKIPKRMIFNKTGHSKNSRVPRISGKA